MARGYVGLGVVAALAIGPVAFLFYEKGNEPHPVAARQPVVRSGLELGEVLRSVRFWKIGIGFFLIGSIVSALGVHLVPLLTDPKIGLRRDAALQVAGVLGAAVTIGRLGAGYIVDRFHPRLSPASL